MTVIVNTDYESVLFHQKPSLKMVRELEFLALWLNERVLNFQSYDDEYLDHIKKYTGKTPVLVSKDPKASKWWGALKDIDQERKLNSKKTSLFLSESIGENFGRIIHSEDDLCLLDSHTTYLFKSFSGVSGKGHKCLQQVAKNDFPLIAEPLHERLLDFSTYCFSSGEKIFYQNFIGAQFGYKGSLFDLEKAHSLEEQPFALKNKDLHWKKYLANVENICLQVRLMGEGGFSIDSYVFNNEIRTLCEINYRRTMGVTAYEIAKIIGRERFQLFVIFKSGQDYSKLKNTAEKLESVLLSHKKNYFNYLMIPAKSLGSLQEKIKQFESILGTSFAVEIE